MSILSAALNQGKNPIKLSSSAKILIITEEIEDIASIIAVCEKGDVVFIDIDDTIQTISSYLFQNSSAQPISEGARIIEAMKKKSFASHNVSFSAFISRWRLSRRIQLVHQDWPNLIQKARERGVLVYGLTHMDTGSCGVMARTEEWRYNELSQLGIAFTPTYLDQEIIKLMELPELAEESPPIFYKGIFFTGSLCTDKKTVLNLYLKNNAAARIILIDDRLQNIQDVQEISFESSVVGIVFRGVDRVLRPHISEDLLDKVIHLQKEYLKNEQWLENDEALAMIALEDLSSDDI